MFGDGREFAGLMEQVKEGSEDAVQKLLETYGGHILRTIRRRLNRRMRSQFDSADFCQAVWASFLAGEQQIPSFTHERDLIGFLNSMATNKVVEECRRRLQGKRYNAHRQGSQGDGGGRVTKNPTASQIVSAQEQFSWLVRGDPTLYRRIVQLRVDGATLDEIAESTGVNERTVRRVIRRLGDRIQP